MNKHDIPVSPTQPDGHLFTRTRVRPLHGTARLGLLIAFAFTVMADPISSVAYAIEAALRALDGNLALLLPTMALVIVVIAIVGTAGLQPALAACPRMTSLDFTSIRTVSKKLSCVTVQPRARRPSANRLVSR